MSLTCGLCGQEEDLENAEAAEGVVQKYVVGGIAGLLFVGILGLCAYTVCALLVFVLLFSRKCFDVTGKFLLLVSDEWLYICSRVSHFVVF